jgi:hypothetical protein
LGIPPFQLFVLQVKLNVDTLSGRYIDALESTQGLARSFCIILLLEINLYNLFTVALTAVCNADSQLQRLSLFDLLFAQ